MITDIVSTTGMLLAFVVILFLAWQASRYLGKNTPYGKKGGKMRILEQLKVGNDQYIILLKLDENQYLLGTSQTGIQVLERFKEEKTNESAEYRLKCRKCSCAGYYHAAYLCSIASFNCSYDEFLYAHHNHTFFYEKCNGSPADAA